MGVPVFSTNLGASNEFFTGSEIEFLGYLHPLDLFGVGLRCLHDQFQQKLVFFFGPPGEMNRVFLESFELKLAELGGFPNEALGQPRPLLFLLNKGLNTKVKGCFFMAFP